MSLYSENPKEYHKQYGRKNRKWIRFLEREARKKRKKWFQEYRASQKCLDCGANHEAILDFHHRNPAEKLFLVTRGVSWNLGRERILAEIAKCDVLCCNCHRIRHHNQRKADKFNELKRERGLLKLPDVGIPPENGSFL
jgi:hypothetical protein